MNSNQSRKRSRSEEAWEILPSPRDAGCDGEPMVKMKKIDFEDMQAMLHDCTRAMETVTKATMESAEIIEDRVNKLLKVSKQLQDVANAMD